jgi:hypothetical protein
VMIEPASVMPALPSWVVCDVVQAAVIRIAAAAAPATTTRLLDSRLIRTR